jgi:tetratricopeptide (TPR) repeat protein
MEMKIHMNNKQVLLQRAEEQFLRKDYTNALKIYGLILRDYPKHKEAKVGAYLSDMGLDNDEDAQALFDYYQVIKRSSDDADQVIDNLMQAIHSTRIIIQQAFGDDTDKAVQEGGISYGDFIRSIEDKGDFKQAFEDIMFSTKVVITAREDFIDFMKRLIEAEYYDMVLGYLDALAGDPAYDQDIYALYRLIPEGH